MIGVLMGLGSGAGVMTIVGLTTIFLRKFRLLWGDRRVWITIMTILTLLAALDFRKWENQTTPTPGNIERAFENCVAGGFVFSVVGIWAILFVILFSWGKNWKAPLAGWSWAVSAILLFVGIFAAIPHPEMEEKALVEIQEPPSEQA